MLDTPMHDQFNTFLQQNGHYVVHIKKQMHLPCPKCYGLQHGQGREPNPRCPLCLGLGFVAKITPRLTRMNPPPRMNFAEQVETSVGILGDSRTMYYFSYDANPGTDDLVLEVTWSCPTVQVMSLGQVIAVHKVHQIESLTPMRGPGGEVVYFKVGAHDTHIDISWLSSCLRNRPLLSNTPAPTRQLIPPQPPIAITTPGALQTNALSLPAGATLPTGTPVYLSSAGTLCGAMATSSMTSDVLGLLIAPVHVGVSGTFLTSGLLQLADWTAITGSPQLVQDAHYFLGTTLGRLVTTPSTSIGNVLLDLGVAVAPDTFFIRIQPMILL